MATSPSRQAVDELFDQVFLSRVVSSSRFDLNPTALKPFEMFRAEFKRSAPDRPRRRSFEISADRGLGSVAALQTEVREQK
ncbi:hypothetical protein [Rhodococcoides fascians]|uniref:hypothetical protein n=1 Tax=Rhodococcoides fascians TaxID=1828 RepID=UPI0024B886D1|nr:hypothetical protein [Rhodococcus fascians]MDJ0412083.1 hypothetical protein [Rhodococcus fascians]